MSVNTETAASYFDLAAKAAERENVNEALHYSERANDLLLRGGKMHRYAPHETYMKNVVRGSDYRKRRRMPFWLYASLHALAVCALVILFFVALMIIMEGAGL